MENYCRFCAEEKNNLSNLSEMKGEVLDWLLAVVNIENDELPQKICYTCLCNVEEFGFFLKKCKQSYDNLKKISLEKNRFNPTENFNDESVSQNYSDEYLEEEILSDSNSQIDSNIWIDKEDVQINAKDPDEKEETFKIEQIDTESNLENFYNRKKFECEYCPNRFNTKYERAAHKKEHNFFCMECGRDFATKTKLNYHLASHKNKRDFQCPYCPKAYNHRSDLTNHLRFSHAGGERPRKYRCELCDKNYCTPTELKIHLRFHRNERPYKCHLCDHAYVIKGHLQQHLKKHADIKDKPCTEPGCGKAYRDMSALKKHMDIHLPDDNKPYTCDVCGRKFSFFYILSDHRRKSHRKIALLQPLKKDEIQV